MNFKDLLPDRKYVRDATQATDRAKDRAREMKKCGSTFPQFGAATANGIRYAMSPVHGGGYDKSPLEGEVI